MTAARTTGGPAADGGGQAADGGGPVLEALDVTRYYRIRRTRARSSVVRAVDGVSLALYRGQITALVGESGSGKSTIARVLAQLEQATSGKVLLDGRQVRRGPGRFRRYARRVQMIFQDPFSSLNPTHRVEYVLSRPLHIHGYARGRRQVERSVRRLLEQVELTPPAQYQRKFPHELSGGQRQRVAVARALAARPEVILADEPVSMLDVSIRLSVLNLLRRLVADSGAALLYITHDIASARYFATTTLVMYAGRLAEGGDSESVTQHPAHPYTRLLISAAPHPGRTGDQGPAADSGEPPSLVRPPAGCRFHPRCPQAMAICSEKVPPRSEIDERHWVHCWLYGNEEEATG